MRRLAPRRIDSALASVVSELRPATTLARVQEVWPQAVGPALSSEARPVSERAGAITVHCDSSVWAQELQLLSGDLVTRLNAALRQVDGAPTVASLRFVAGGPERRS